MVRWPRGLMDKASAYGAGDCRFESCRGHAFSYPRFPLSIGFLSAVASYLSKARSFIRRDEEACAASLPQKQTASERVLGPPGLTKAFPRSHFARLIFLVSGFHEYLMIRWPRGPMDKASAYGAGDCRFESCRGHSQSIMCSVNQVTSAHRSGHTNAAEPQGHMV